MTQNTTKNDKREQCDTKHHALKIYLNLSRRQSQKSFCDRRTLVNLLVESTRRISHTAHLQFLDQYRS